MNAFANDSFGRASIVSTLVDAAVEFARGNTLSGLVLAAAAALSTRVKGAGVAASGLLRLVRWVRSR